MNCQTELPENEQETFWFGRGAKASKEKLDANAYTCEDIVSKLFCYRPQTFVKRWHVLRKVLWLQYYANVMYFLHKVAYNRKQTFTELFSHRIFSLTRSNVRTDNKTNDRRHAWTKVFGTYHKILMDRGVVPALDTMWRIYDQWCMIHQHIHAVLVCCSYMEILMKNLLLY